MNREQNFSLDPKADVHVNLFGKIIIQFIHANHMLQLEYKLSLPIKYFNIHIIMPLDKLHSLTTNKTTHTHTNKTEKQKFALPIFLKHISTQIDQTVSVEMHSTHISQLVYILCNALNQCTESCQSEIEIINIH